MSRYLFIQSQDPFTETRTQAQYELAGSLAAGKSSRGDWIDNLAKMPGMSSYGAALRSVFGVRLGSPIPCCGWVFSEPDDLSTPHPNNPARLSYPSGRVRT